MSRYYWNSDLYSGHIVRFCMLFFLHCIQNNWDHHYHHQDMPNVEIFRSLFLYFSWSSIVSGASGWHPYWLNVTFEWTTNVSVFMFFWEQNVSDKLYPCLSRNASQLLFAWKWFEMEGGWLWTWIFFVVCCFHPEQIQCNTQHPRICHLDSLPISTTWTVT